LLVALAIQNFIEDLISNYLLAPLIWVAAGLVNLLLFKHSLVVLLALKFIFLQLVLMVTNLKHACILQHIRWSTDTGSAGFLILLCQKFIVFNFSEGVLLKSRSILGGCWLTISYFTVQGWLGTWDWRSLKVDIHFFRLL
jgi:hypothetical protein